MLEINIVLNILVYTQKLSISESKAFIVIFESNHSSSFIRLNLKIYKPFYLLSFIFPLKVLLEL